MTGLTHFVGMRAAAVGTEQQRRSPLPCSRTGLVILAQRAVNKKAQVVLTTSIPGLGKPGDLKNVAVGYFRNYLLPQGLATVATQEILDEIKAATEADQRAKQQEKARAEAMATALRTIGKFIIKKKVGENEQIFGSVTTGEVVSAIAQQTGKELDKKAVELPDIKTTGTYDCSVRLHPEVLGYFKVVVQREKNVN